MGEGAQCQRASAGSSKCRGGGGRQKRQRASATGAMPSCAIVARLRLSASSSVAQKRRRPSSSAASWCCVPALGVRRWLSGFRTRLRSSIGGGFVLPGAGLRAQGSGRGVQAGGRLNARQRRGSGARARRWHAALQMSGTQPATRALTQMRRVIQRACDVNATWMRCGCNADAV